MSSFKLLHKLGLHSDETIPENVVVKTDPDNSNITILLTADNKHSPWCGAILDTSVPRLLCTPLPEVVEDCAEFRLKQCNLAEWFASRAHDATAIRMFWNPATASWLYATDHFPNAAHRRWISPKNFTQLFSEAVEAFDMTLASLEELLKPVDAEKAQEQAEHVFMFQHPDHRLVTPIGTPDICYIGSTTNHVRYLDDRIPPSFARPQALTPLEYPAPDFKFITHLISNMSWIERGIRLYHPGKHQVAIIENPAFRNTFELKGNTAHMITHVIRLWLHEHLLAADKEGLFDWVCSNTMLELYFPEFKGLVQSVVSALDSLIGCVKYKLPIFRKYRALCNGGNGGNGGKKDNNGAANDKKPSKIPAGWYRVFSAYDRNGFLPRDITGELYGLIRDHFHKHVGTEGWALLNRGAAQHVPKMNLFFSI